MPERLSDTEIKEKLSTLSGWLREGEEIEKNYKFKDFGEALEFVNKIGAEAEKMDHHPDLLLHDWNQVKVTLSTHSAKGLTNNDIELAGKIEAL
jgi:4a-hydroxytetrahydrobiopterin dehydratase